MWRSFIAGSLAAIGVSSLKLATNDEFEQPITFILYAVFVISNVLMWYLQLNGMANSTTTVNPILIFTSANFISTGILGYTFHKESHDIPWFIGLILLLSGVFVVQSSKSSSVKLKEKGN